MNNKAKKIFAYLTITAVLISFCGCGKKMSVPEAIKSGHGGAELYVKRELANEIADSINSNDPDRIRALMSDYALDQSNYEKEIKQLFDMVPDGFTPQSAYCYSSLSDDKPWWEGSDLENHYLGGQFKFTAENGEQYTLYFYWIKICSAQPEKQGIHHFTVVSKKARDKKDYTIRGVDDKPGIYFYE